MIDFLRSLASSEDGATMVEYALMVALIAVAASGTLFFLCINIQVVFLKIASKLLGI